MNNSASLYVRLFHGRDTREDRPSDWGYDGPIIGPVGVSWTYGNPKLHKPDWSTFEHLPVSDDLVHYAGRFYGDFEVFQTGDPALAAARKTHEQHTYEAFEINLKHPPT